MKKILIVDDEPHVIRIMKMTFEREGFDVQSAKNGEEGLECIRASHPDALILDIDMPKMNGKELCVQIHAEYPDHNIPIFVATSRAEDELREWTQSFPKVEFLEKPVGLRALTNKLNILFTGDNAGTSVL